MITDIRDFTTTPLPIPKIFLVVYLLNLRSECLVSYDPHFPGNDGTNETRELESANTSLVVSCTHTRHTLGCDARSRSRVVSRMSEHRSDISR